VNNQQTARRIIIFALLVNAVGWLGSFLGGDPTSPGLGFLIWGIAPIAVSLLMRAFTRDWSDLGIKPGVQENVPWYLLSLLAYPVGIALMLGLGTLFGATSFHDFSPGAFIQAVLPAMVLYLFFALFEEVGWRGYLAPKMYALSSPTDGGGPRLNGLVAHALVGVIWASWHLPYIGDLSTYTTESLATYLPRFFLGCFAFAIVYGEIRMRTASFWPAVLMHWVGNSIGNPLLAGFVTLTPGREVLGSFGVDGVFMILLFGLLGLLLYRRRVGQGSSG
jgi:membrane protease YdiL (CAAX protease family)